MKGITPIISIIILLLLTVGLAATAWTYMANYLTGITAKNIEISTQKCVTGRGTNAGEDAMAVIHNMGTATINVTNDITIWDKNGFAVPDVGINWTTIEGGVISDISPGRYGKVNIDCCGGTGAQELTGQGDCPKTCTYDILVGGRVNTVTVYCP